MKKEKLKPIIQNFSKLEIKTQKLNYKKITKDLKWSQKTDMDNGIKKTVTNTTTICR